MSNNTLDLVREKLEGLSHPELGKSLGELEMIQDLQLSGSTLRFTLQLLTLASPVREVLVELCKNEANKVSGVEQVEVEISARQRSTQPALGGGALTSVRNVLAVASGKGGVGKSTVASNLAAALSRDGAAVGLLDADIYGPSIPALLGIDRNEVRIKEKKILPVEKFGLKVMSMGLLMKPGESVIWRGPMLHGMMRQFCTDVEWGELDFLVVDLPPGTGDVALSLSQLVPIGGALVVSTPQDVALGVATKAVNMFAKLKVPVIGMVENMSHYVCPACGERDDVFGHGGTERAAEDLKLNFLGEIPLNSLVRKAGDAGVPLVIQSPDSAPAQALQRIARLAAGRLAVAAEIGYEKILENLPQPA